MNHTVLALVVGLVAGVCGALVPTALVGQPTDTTTTDGSTDLRPVLERLEAIEARLDRIQPEPLLRGSAGSGGGAEGVAAATATHLEAVLARIDERVGDVVRETMDEKWKELGYPPGAPSELVEIPAKKEVTLAEAAAELELTAYEEQEVRRVHEETMNKLVELLASEEDGGVATVRRDLEEARDNPEKRVEMVGKYMGRVFGNLGGIIMLGQEHEKRMQEAVGEEKARKLDQDYELTDVDPYDLEGILSDTFGD